MSKIGLGQPRQEIDIWPGSESVKENNLTNQFYSPYLSTNRNQWKLQLSYSKTTCQPNRSVSIPNYNILHICALSKLKIYLSYYSKSILVSLCYSSRGVGPGHYNNVPDLLNFPLFGANFVKYCPISETPVQ